MAVASRAFITRQHSIGVDCVAEGLARIGAEESDFLWPNVTLAASEVRVDSIAADGLARRTLATRDLDELKSWIGVSDVDIRSGRRVATHHRPATLQPGALTHAETLDVGQWRELRRAFSSYVFGDSTKMQQWRSVIDRHLSPFVIDVVTANEIYLPADSRLVLLGNPVLFAAKRMIFAGGTFVSTVDGYYAFNEFTRGGAA